MHELSVAVSLVELVCEEAARRDARVLAVHLHLGPLSGVVEEALRFSFDLATEGTSAAGARLVIEHVPIVANCQRCHVDREIPSAQRLCCPVCGTPTPNVIHGSELELRAIEIDEHVAAHR
ncbi:MAG TPA: hydrogenase maturation nickel metallochaperone HypA [Gemmatimonadaceae bacterium]|jgi:hydrogenase nickel incorporation protein HypA/HybF